MKAYKVIKGQVGVERVAFELGESSEEILFDSQLDELEIESSWFMITDSIEVDKNTITKEIRGLVVFLIMGQWFLEQAILLKIGDACYLTERELERLS